MQQFESPINSIHKKSEIPIHTQIKQFESTIHDYCASTRFGADRPPHCTESNPRPQIIAARIHTGQINRRPLELKWAGPAQFSMILACAARQARDIFGPEAHMFWCI